MMASNIMDKDLKNLRNERWEKAFSESAVQESEQIHMNRKAMIVIEHLLQASDVAHTMQHWHIYQKWNECLFEEMHCAYKAGRAKKDPAEFVYLLVVTTSTRVVTSDLWGDYLSLLPSSIRLN